jgi:hypothetical protein
VYLLHGNPGRPADWFRGGQVQQVMDAMLRDHLVQPMIVVAPNGSGGWLHDSEMLSRAIGGISSGAYGVLNLGLRHPDLFSVILGEMPYGDPGPVAGAPARRQPRPVAGQPPGRVLSRMAFHHPMAVDLLAGTRDPTGAEAGRLVAMLQARGQEAVDTVHPGSQPRLARGPRRAARRAGLCQPAPARPSGRPAGHRGGGPAVSGRRVLRPLLISQGGSDLTQQYVKNVVTGDQRSLHRKLVEALEAVRTTPAVPGPAR